MDLLKDIVFILNENFLMLVEALFITIELTAASLLLGVTIGLIVAFFKISHFKVLNRIANFYLTIIRGMPLIVLIAIFYFGIYNIITLSPFWAGVIALGVHNGAYIGEIFRGTIQSIDRGQMEASRSLGMSYSLAMRRIILPQAFKRAIPPLGNQFIIGLKDSSLVFFIGVSELWGTGLSIAARNFMQLQTYLVVAIFYLGMVLFFSWLVSLLEKRLDVDKREEVTKI